MNENLLLKILQESSIKFYFIIHPSGVVEIISKHNPSKKFFIRAHKQNEDRIKKLIRERLA